MKLWEILIPHYSTTPFLVLEPREHLQRVFLENLGFVFCREPRDAFDIRPHVVVPLAGAWIGLGAGARSLGAEKATLRTADAEQQLQRLNVVKRRVEVELLKSLIEILRVVGSAQLRAPT